MRIPPLPHLFVLVLCLLPAAADAGAQSIQLDAQFPGGNLNSWSESGGLVTVQDNLAPGGWEWLYFRATGVDGLTPQFRTPVTSTGDVYRAYHRMVWRPVGDPVWRFMDQGWRPGDGYYWFGNTQAFTVDAIEVAYWFPYRFEELLPFLRRVQASGGTQVQGLRRIGASFESRPLIAFSITDPSVPSHQKRQVVVVARQHGYESFGNYALEGLVDFLLGPDPFAAALRRRAEFHVYPMANPDAVENGWTREGRHRTGIGFVDLNRDWAHGAPSTGGAPSDTLEIDALRDDIVLRTGGSADFLLDLHSHAKGSQGLGWYWWYRGDPALAQALFQSTWNDDQARFPGSPIFSWPTHPAGSGTTTAMAWGGPTGPGSGTLGGLGLTLEPIAAPFGSNRSIDRIREGGVSVLRGLARVL